MEEELHNFLMVWSSVIASTFYCYGISKLIPKGVIRLFMFSPVMYLYLILPLKLKYVLLLLPTAFFVTWQTSFKLILLAFGIGPLSIKSLSLAQFVTISCLPINITQSPSKRAHKKEKSKKPKTGPKVSPLPLIPKALILIFLLNAAFYKEKFPRDVVLFFICIFVYVGLEVLLELAAVIGGFLLRRRIQIEPPFDKPYLSTSLQDFWGRRWNRVSSRSLRLVVFQPTISRASRFMGRKWAAFTAFLVTFLVSDLMHEILFYYLGRVRPDWGTILFFIMHGLCLIIESVIKRSVDAKWQLQQKVMGPLVFGFTVCTFMWLSLPELLEHKVDDRVLQEFAALGRFVKDLCVSWSKMCYDLVLQRV